MKRIAAGQFKARCLSLLDEVAKTHETVVITKYGRPVAQVVPVLQGEADSENPLKDSIVFEKNLVDPIDADWGETP